jgi:hypothetical protein
MKLVILQPCYFPWGGIFEQIRLADVYVHYDDVQYSKGGFTNRVQVKTANDRTWMTVPVNASVSTDIKDTTIDTKHDWQRKHLALLRQSYARAPYLNDAMEIAERVIGADHKMLGALNIAGIEAAAEYLGFKPKFMRSSEMNIGGASSERVADICKHLGAKTYITGLGAMKYIDYSLFDDAGISLEYMNYQKAPYPQAHGDFTPFVTILDTIAHCGRDAAKYLQSGTTYWRDVPAAVEALAKRTA